MKDAPPKVAVETAEPKEPQAGGTLTVQLRAQSEVKEPLQYQYRLGLDETWLTAPEGRFTLSALKPGKLTLEVRAVGARAGSSAVVQREWMVKLTEKFDSASNASWEGGVLKLKKVPPVTTDNQNTLITKYRPRIKMTASTIWSGWPAEQAIDGNIETSWFSAQGDAAALGKRPWVQALFPEEVTVARVTILGNREPAWLVGYTIFEGNLVFYDGAGRMLKNIPSKGIGNFRDFDFKLSPAVPGVRTIRFWSVRDQGNHTVHKDIAIAEFQAE